MRLLSSAAYASARSSCDWLSHSIAWPIQVLSLSSTSNRLYVT